MGNLQSARTKPEDALYEVRWSLDELAVFTSESAEALEEKLKSPSHDFRDRHNFIQDSLVKLCALIQAAYLRVCNLNELKRQAAKLKSSPKEKAALDSRSDAIKTELTRMLHNYDTTKHAVRWLEREFVLLVESEKIGNEIRGAAGDARMSLTEFNQLHKKLVSRVGKCLDDVTALKKEAMVIGLRTLDTNMSGYLEPEEAEASNISTLMFARLDESGKHRVSPDDLIKAMDKGAKQLDRMQYELEDLQKEIGKLEEKRPEEAVQAEEAGVEIDKRKQEADKRKAEIESERQLLETIERELHRAFIRGFVEIISKSNARPGGVRLTTESKSETADTSERDRHTLEQIVQSELKELANKFSNLLRELSEWSRAHSADDETAEKGGSKRAAAQILGAPSAASSSAPAVSPPVSPPTSAQTPATIASEQLQPPQSKQREEKPRESRAPLEQGAQTTSQPQPQPQPPSEPKEAVHASPSAETPSAREHEQPLQKCPYPVHSKFPQVVQPYAPALFPEAPQPDPALLPQPLALPVENPYEPLATPAAGVEEQPQAKP